MKPEEAIKQMKEFMVIDDWSLVYLPELHDALELAIEALKEMPVEEYRQRLMEVFHKTDHDELLTYVVQPKEEEFKSLEDILRQYRFEPRPHGDCRDRLKEVFREYSSISGYMFHLSQIENIIDGEVWL